MNVLYVSDSPTLSGAEVVLLGDLDHFRARGFECSAYLPAHNTRLVAELERRGVPTTTTTAYSRILLESTLNPKSLAHFARAFWRVGREIGAELARVTRSLEEEYGARGRGEGLRVKGAQSAVLLYRGDVLGHEGEGFSRPSLTGAQRADRLAAERVGGEVVPPDPLDRDDLPAF